MGRRAALGAVVRIRESRTVPVEIARPMSTAPAANLMGITGIARRLVLDGALDEAVARKAMDGATAEKMLRSLIIDPKGMASGQSDRRR